MPLIFSHLVWDTPLHVWATHESLVKLVCEGVHSSTQGRLQSLQSKFTYVLSTSLTNHKTVVLLKFN